MTDIPPIDPVNPSSPEETPPAEQPLESTPPIIGMETPLETPVVEEPPTEVPPVELPKKPSWLSRFGHWLFNPESRIGKFNRAALRVLTLVVVLFAAGAMLVYFWLYRPAQQAWQSSQENLVATQQELNQVESELNNLRIDYDKAASEVENLRTRYQVMGMLSQVNDARVALLSEDSAAAQTALDEAKKIMEEALPALEKLDKDNAAQIKLRLSLAESELITDPETALKDLEILVNGLTLTEKALAVE